MRTAHSRVIFPLVGGVLITAVLAACDSVTPEQCAAGDWRGIGFTDGTKGRTADYIAQHQKACAKLGVSPDLDAWLAGRKQGLPQYCTPSKAYEVGRSGRSISPVCTASQMNAMRDAHYTGQRYHDISDEISRLQSERLSVNSKLRDIPSKAEGEERRQKRRLEDERDRIDRLISQFESERYRYDSWLR